MEVHVSVKAGPRKVGVVFYKKDSAEPDLLLQPFLRSNFDQVDETGLPEVSTLVIAGPFHATGRADTPSRRSIFACRPSGSDDEVACAKKIILTLGRRAYRRPLTENDLELLLGFYQSGRNQGGTFDAGIESAVRVILASPNFLFRFDAFRRIFPRTPCIASAIWISPRGYRSSCGAAFPTTNFSALGPPGSSGIPPCSIGR